MKHEAVWYNNSTRVGATVESAVFMFGIQKLEVTRKASSSQEQAEVHVYNSTGWQLGVENVNKNLFTVRCTLSTVRS